MRVHGILHPNRAKSAQKIGRQEGDATQPVLYFVPENVKKIHVSQKVKKPSVKEHGRKGRPQVGVRRNETMLPDIRFKVETQEGSVKDITVQTD
jgi:hypothetical protein